MKIESNIQHVDRGGWWFGIWQDERLVAFGAGYSGKSRCLRAMDRNMKIAQKEERPTVLCMNPHIQRPVDRIEARQPQR